MIGPPDCPRLRCGGTVDTQDLGSKRPRRRCQRGLAGCEDGQRKIGKPWHAMANCLVVLTL